jgi:curved DNA-binding protein
MTAADSPETLTPLEARAILGLAPDAGPETLIGAFRAAAKRAHPDQGGDADSFRRVLEAYRLLQTRPLLPAPTAFAAPTEVEPYVEISAQVALVGGEVETTLEDGKRARVRIPAGARHGDTLKAGERRLRVRIASDEALQARGSDLWFTVTVPVAILEHGGRVSVETPLGAKTFWVTKKIAERGLIRLEGQGLPAQGDHPQGHLFLRLAPDTGAPESAARAQLKKFAAAWAA